MLTSPVSASPVPASPVLASPVLAVVPQPLGELILLQPPNPEENPAAVYLASLAPGSRRSMTTALHLMAALLTSGRCDAFSLHWGALRFQHTAALRAALAERYAAASANHRLAALRGVLKAAWNLGQIPTEEYHRAINLPPVRGESLPRGRALSPGELRMLFHICAQDTTAAGVRDAALLAVLYGIGLRRSEVVALDLKDYDAETGALTVRSGKGNKARIGYASRGVKAALEKWLFLRGDVEGALLLPVLKSGRIVFRRLTDQAILSILVKRARQAGVKHLSPHDLRRTFISDLLDAGADISTVQKMAGHANVTTTTRYDRRGETAKQKAADLLHVPVEP
jgi:site-specific recombinase XerD